MPIMFWILATGNLHYPKPSKFSAWNSCHAQHFLHSLLFQPFQNFISTLNWIPSCMSDFCFPDWCIVALESEAWGFQHQCSMGRPRLLRIDLQLIGWRPLTLGKAICFSQSIDSNVNLIWKHCYRHTQNSIDQISGYTKPSPVDT